MKTNTLTGADLNRAVAMALGRKIVKLEDNGRWSYVVHTQPGGPIFGNTEAIPDYACDIGAAWPVLKEHKINIQYCTELRDRHRHYVWACMDTNSYHGYSDGHDHPELAALRCFVASVFGDTVDLEH